MGEEDSNLLELAKVKPVEEEEEETNTFAEQTSKRKPDHRRVESPQNVQSSSPNWRRRHPFLACCTVCCSLLILTLVILIILAFTLLKVKDPQLYVDSISLDSFSMSLPFNIPPSFSINASLGLHLSIHNPNRASVKYTNSTAHMFYRGIDVGFLPIPPGRIGARDTEQISSTIDLMADRLIGSPDIISDLTNGSLPFSTTAYISGRVKVLNVYKHHFHTSSVCNVTVFTSNRSTSDMICTYDFKL